MLSYGLKSTYTTASFTRNLQQRLNSQARKVSFPKQFKPRLNFRKFSLVVPSGWDYLIFSNSNINKKTFIYIYSNTYYFRIPTPNQIHSLVPDTNSSTIAFVTPYVTNFDRLYWTQLLQVFYAFSRPFFLKVKFKGKGYYIFKNRRQTITPQFGHSHRLYTYAYFSSVKFLSKTHIFIFGLLKGDALRVAFNIKAMRPINIFTGRGVRFSRQIIYKKVGKVSSYR